MVSKKDVKDFVSQVHRAYQETEKAREMMIRLNKGGGMSLASYLHGKGDMWGKMRSVASGFSDIEDMIDSVGKYMLGEIGVKEENVSVRMGQLIERLEGKLCVESIVLSDDEIDALSDLVKNPNGVLRNMMSSNEVKAANKLVKVGFAFKGTSDDRQHTVQYSATDEGIDFMDKLKVGKR